MDALQLRIYALFFLNNLRDEGIYTVNDHVIDFGPTNYNETIKGNFLIEKLEATGFETLDDITIMDIEASEDEDNNNILCVKNIKLDNLNLTVDYVADMGVGDEYPVYGTGTLTYDLSEINLEFCSFINFNEPYVDDFDMKISYKHQPMSISGVYTNEDVSANVTKYMSAGNAAFAMFNAYEQDCGSCILNPLAQAVINLMLNYGNNTFSMSCPCAKDIFGIEFEDIKHLFRIIQAGSLDV